MAENELFKSALSKAMTLCSRREYCNDDIIEKLRSWGVSDSDSRKIINTLTRENFINERRYAEAYVRDKFKYNKWGRMKIRAGLKARKISGETIDSALSSIDDDQYRKVLEELLDSHRRTIRAKNQYDLKGKQLRYGLSKGFESGLLYDILGG